MPEDITLFAKTNYRDSEQVFGIKPDDRRRHMYVLGKTGMGKTTLMENMAASDIRSGKGVAIVDPHGEFAEKMLRVVPKSRINDVVYFNPADIKHPIAFNILEKVGAEYKHLVADGLVGVFKKIWADSWGPRLEYILRNAILALLDYPSSTLLGVTRMLVDNNYRKKVVEKIKDPVVKSFWVDEYANYSERFRNEAISPIQNKVGQFLSTALIRNIVGQPTSTLNMRKLMDEGKIVLMNLSKGRVGEENSALLGAMMITKIQLAAMSRADVLEDERPDFYLYVDEFQNFATESFASILSEARKYRLNLIIGHQYITQMEEVVRDAVFGNVGTIVTFRVGAADAEFLEKEFAPTFFQIDLVNLARYNVALKLMIDGVASSAFSATGLPPLFEGEEGCHEKIIKVSRERYAKPREVVEDKIARWSGMTEAQLAEKERRKQQSAEQSARDRGASGNSYRPPYNRDSQSNYNRGGQRPNYSVPRQDNNRKQDNRPSSENYQNTNRSQTIRQSNRQENNKSRNESYTKQAPLPDSVASKQGVPKSIPQPTKPAGQTSKPKVVRHDTKGKSENYQTPDQAKNKDVKEISLSDAMKSTVKKFR